MDTRGPLTSGECSFCKRILLLGRPLWKTSESLTRLKEIPRTTLPEVGLDPDGINRMPSGGTYANFFFAENVSPKDLLSSTFVLRRRAGFSPARKRTEAIHQPFRERACGGTRGDGGVFRIRSDHEGCRFHDVSSNKLAYRTFRQLFPDSVEAPA